MIAILSVIALTAACFGAGAFGLRLLGLMDDRAPLERTMLGVAVGFGVLGWLLFWIGTGGLLTSPVLWGFCLILALGNILYFIAANHTRPAPSLDLVSWALIVLLALAALFDLFEAISPPADGDTLAYHFTLARRFSEARNVFFVPVRFQGAIPLLVHMSYTAAYFMGSAGGEASATWAITGWAFVSGWMASGLLFAIALRYVSFNWALALALLFQTFPAMVFGAGSGQIEARMAMFVLIAALGLIDSRNSDKLSPIILLALGAGFYAASKYLGLLFAAAAAAALLSTGGPVLKRLVVYCVVLAIAGTQWYGWNFVHTGNPVFPMMYELFQFLGTANDVAWNSDFNSDLKSYLIRRADVTNGWHWILSYPFIATLAPPHAIDSGRIGLGPLFLLLAPLVMLSLWKARQSIIQSQLFPVALLIFVFYVLWFNFGVIPKIRHILPIIPLLLLCAGVAAASQYTKKYRGAAALAVLLSLAVNFGAHVLFSVEFIRHMVSGETDDSFLDRNVFAYPVVRKINANKDIKGILVWDRQLQYYIKAKSFFVASYAQILIDTRPGRINPKTLFEQLKMQGLSHLALNTPKSGIGEPGTLLAAVQKLELAGCVVLEEIIPYTRFGSRTLKNLNVSSAQSNIWAVQPQCNL
ncbi:MAG: hypothetical protein HOO19_13920 [Rhodospirillaceae bacterium]|nr:hypothetical protein [Rhodospirillaceae bacterium]MBT3885236.1 hypothetical protein [Rhodospirillaceae bacterium]MBT4115498.1 hypothetical protein [Rhodospirillaceae bacterium]MBT4673551.1 hypothetical protein [Rhodospirillaceae bacterium]MBT4750426.1 hypothetical protein [Rhodospirillaceae bacterium]